MGKYGFGLVGSSSLLILALAGCGGAEPTEAGAGVDPEVGVVHLAADPGPGDSACPYARTYTLNRWYVGTTWCNGQCLDGCPCIRTSGDPGRLRILSPYNGYAYCLTR
jgi:hypothetical protein